MAAASKARRRRQAPAARPACSPSNKHAAPFQQTGRRRPHLEERLDAGFELGGRSGLLLRSEQEAVLVGAGLEAAQPRLELLRRQLHLRHNLHRLVRPPLLLRGGRGGRGVIAAVGRGVGRLVHRAGLFHQQLAAQQVAVHLAQLDHGLQAVPPLLALGRRRTARLAHRHRRLVRRRAGGRGRAPAGRWGSGDRRGGVSGGDGVRAG